MSRLLTKNNILILLITLGIVFFLFAEVIPASAQQLAQAGVPSTQYESLSPLPGTETVDVDNPADYFKTLFKVFIGVISVLAVIKLMLCGFQYMTSEAISSKENAKKCIGAVLLGIFLILLSYLILQTINPDLVRIHFDTLKPKLQSVAPGSDASQASTGDQPSVCTVIWNEEVQGTVTYESQDICLDNCSYSGCLERGIDEDTCNESSFSCS